MNTLKKPNKPRFVLYACIAIILFVTGTSLAEGISDNVWFTPVKGQWIFSLQVDYLKQTFELRQSKSEHKSYNIPFVASYGLDHDMMLMIKHSIVEKHVYSGNFANPDNTGYSDVFILVKYRLAYRETAIDMWSVSPILGLSIPIGSADHWILHFGSLFCGRINSFKIDFGVKYIWNKLIELVSEERGLSDEFFAQTIFAYRIPLGKSEKYALTPIVESTFRQDIPYGRGSRLQVFSLSPGFRLTLSSVYLEVLMPISHWYLSSGNKTASGNGLLVGIRYIK